MRSKSSVALANTDAGSSRSCRGPGSGAVRSEERVLGKIREEKKCMKKNNVTLLALQEFQAFQAESPHLELER